MAEVKAQGESSSLLPAAFCASKQIEGIFVTHEKF